MDCVLILSKLLSLIVGITRGVEGGGGYLLYIIMYPFHIPSFVKWYLMHLP